MSNSLEQLVQELAKRENALAQLIQRRDGATHILKELPQRLPLRVIAEDPESHRTWELTGLYYMFSNRLHEALAVFWALYQHMLDAQVQLARRLHKGMPLVWMADCYGALRFPVHAKRYLMLTLCEDALRESGSVSPETTGIYFRLVWGHGLPHSEINRYAQQFHLLANESEQISFFPEALLQELDDDWQTASPSSEEASYYRINPSYVHYLLKGLGKTEGIALEKIAEYLMSSMPGCRTKRRQQSGSTDYDLVCSMEGLDVDYRSELGRYFVCECKDWAKPADFTVFAKFCRVLDSTKSRFGILFSKDGISGSAAREQLKVLHDRGIVIVVIDAKDLERVAEGTNLIHLLRRRYEAVRLDLSGSGSNDKN